MAAGSLKRRQSKRSNSKPSIVMPSRPSHQSFLAHRTTALLLFISLIFFAVLVSGISLNVLRRSPKYEVQSPMIYSIEVVNEFPHDPRAFTQVSQFLSHFEFIIPFFFFFFSFLVQESEFQVFVLILTNLSHDSPGTGLCRKWHPIWVNWPLWTGEFAFLIVTAL